LKAYADALVGEEETESRGGAYAGDLDGEEIESLEAFDELCV
jgi:hypothetical protein